MGKAGKTKNPRLKQMQLKKLYPEHKAFSNPLNTISDIKLPTIDRSAEDNQAGVYKCVAFCYPQRGRSFIIRGNKHLITAMLMEYNVPMFVHFIVFSLTKRIIIDRSYNVFGSASQYSICLNSNVKNNPYTGLPSGSKGNTRNWITVLDTAGKKVLFSRKLRVFPRKWLTELDPFMIFHSASDPFKEIRTFNSLFKAKFGKTIPVPSVPFVPPVFPVIAPIKEVDAAFAAREEKAKMDAQERADTVNMLKELGIFSNGSIMDMDEDI